MKIDFCLWDSNFFKIKIGKVNIVHSPKDILLKFLQTALSDGYKLLYAFGDVDLKLDDEILMKYSGKLIEQKYTYSRIITAQDFKETNAFPYQSTELTNDLELLALLSGTHSRFRLDHGFEETDFRRLYKTWIARSLNNEIADKVFVVTENSTVMAMITLKCTTNAGVIGLCAVSELSQGKGYGRNLINACVNELILRNIPELIVSTQMENNAACKFYEKTGFSIKSIKNTYHFWL